MNRLLRAPQENYPSLLYAERVLQYGEALDCVFNRRGTLLACGLQSGYCVIWDFETRGVSLTFRAHDLPVVAVGFSRSGRFLVTGAGTACAVWDLQQLRDDAPAQVHLADIGPTGVASLVVHPRNRPLFLCCPINRPPLLVDWSTGEQTPVAPDVFAPPADELTPQERIRQPTYTACFDRYGHFFFLGDTRGALHLVHLDTNAYAGTLQISGKDGIRSLSVDRDGKFLAVNCTRAIRLYSILLASAKRGKKSKDEGTKAPPAAAAEQDPPAAAEPDAQAAPKSEPVSATRLPEALQQEHEFMDVVNNWTWARCCFSRDSEYVVAGVHLEHSHKIYMWDVFRGHLQKILEGPRKDGLRTLCWHPLEMTFVSLSALGDLTVWSINVQESWSAYAPDFTELEENVEYVEREDEFDIVDKAAAAARADADEQVDIETAVKIGEESDFEDGPDDLFYLPSRPAVMDETVEEDEAEAAAALPTAAATDRPAPAPAMPTAAEAPAVKRSDSGGGGGGGAPKRRKSDAGRPSKIPKSRRRDSAKTDGAGRKADADDAEVLQVGDADDDAMDAMDAVGQSNQGSDVAAAADSGETRPTAEQTAPTGEAERPPEEIADGGESAPRAAPDAPSEAGATSAPEPVAT